MYLPIDKLIERGGGKSNQRSLESGNANSSETNQMIDSNTTVQRWDRDRETR